MADTEWVEQYVSKLVDYVNGLRNHFSERIEILESENAALQRELATLQERTAAIPTPKEMRETHNALRDLFMQQRALTSHVLPNVADFEHEVVTLIGEPVLHAPERFKLAPKLPSKTSS